MRRPWIAWLALCAAAAAGQQIPKADPVRLTLAEAEQMALRNNPQIARARYVAKAYEEITREFRAVYFPTLEGDVTAAGADSGSRLAAGGLNNPVLYSRAATGVIATQLITNFGRTNSLVGAAALNAQARQAEVITTQNELILRTDAAFLAVLRSQALLRVGSETVESRRLISDQINALFQNKLKSSLDLSFANVNLSEAKLQLSAARNDLRSAEAQLARLLSLPGGPTFELADPVIATNEPGDLDALLRQALDKRPDLTALRLQSGAAHKFAEAEGRLSRPEVGLVGAAGYVPAGDAPIASTYGAIALNIRVPVFNGGLYRARRFEAEARAAASDSAVSDLVLQVQNEVRIAWLSAQNAYEKLGLTQELLDQAKLALDLAQARYNLGLSSIVELSQSQLQYTSAQISQASARFDYDAQTRVLQYQAGQLP